MRVVLALRRQSLLICALGLGAATASCIYPPTEVLVVLNTDAPVTQALTIVATVRLGTALSGTGTVHRWVRGTGVPGSIRLPGSFAIVPPAGGNIDLPVSVVIDASLAAVNPADRPLQFRVVQRFSFTRHQTTYVRIFLSTQCASLGTGCRTAIPALCTIAQLCEDRGQTCGEAGRCVPQALIPEPLVDAGATTMDGSRTDARSDGSIDVRLGDVPRSDATDVVTGPDVTCPATCPSPPNATGSCVGSMCRVTCNSGFEDCDANMANGCEVAVATNIDHCGRCGNVCPTPAGATRGCSGGVCGIACTSGRADCNGSTADGCETDLNGDNANCGGCRRVCSPLHATARCQSGTCDYSSCDAGFTDLDGNRTNGCECATDSVADTCGGAMSLGAIGVGGSRTANGNIAPSADSDWYDVSFAPGGAPSIQVTTDPGGVRLEVVSGCGAAAACMSGSSGSVTAWSFDDTVPPAMGGTTRNVPYPGSMRFRVFSGTPSCMNYAVRVSN